MSQHDERIEKSRKRLEEALDRLVQGVPVRAKVRNDRKITVSAVAQEAGMKRNAIYVNHIYILERIRNLQSASRDTESSKRRSETQLRQRVTDLEAQLKDARSEALMYLHQMEQAAKKDRRVTSVPRRG